MTKEDFIKKWGHENAEFIADLNSIAPTYISSPDYEEDDYDDDDFWDGSMDEQDREDEEYERQCERAFACTCGAYQFSSKGNPVHVADCICGAD